MRNSTVVEQHTINIEQLVFGDLDTEYWVTGSTPLFFSTNTSIYGKYQAQYHMMSVSVHPQKEQSVLLKSLFAFLLLVLCCFAPWC